MHMCLVHNFFFSWTFHSSNSHNSNSHNSNCDKIQIVTKNQLGFNLKGSANHAELWANIDANHACTQFSQLFFLQIFFFFILMKEYVLVFENYQFLHKLKKIKTTFHLPVIYLYFTYMNTFWAKPNDP